MSNLPKGFIEVTPMLDDGSEGKSLLAIEQLNVHINKHTQCNVGYSYSNYSSWEVKESYEEIIAKIKEAQR